MHLSLGIFHFHSEVSLCFRLRVFYLLSVYHPYLICLFPSVVVFMSQYSLQWLSSCSNERRVIQMGLFDKFSTKNRNWKFMVTLYTTSAGNVISVNLAVTIHSAIMSRYLQVTTNTCDSDSTRIPIIIATASAACSLSSSISIP